MAAEQAAGIPLLSCLGWHQIIQPSHTPRHRSHLAHEARHPPSSRKNHDGSLAQMLNSVKSVAILSDSLQEKTAEKKGIRVHQVDFRLALHTSDSVYNMQTGHSGKTLTSGLLPILRDKYRHSGDAAFSTGGITFLCCWDETAGAQCKLFGCILKIHPHSKRTSIRWHWSVDPCI
jgi:hypothetical protein